LARPAYRRVTWLRVELWPTNVPPFVNARSHHCPGEPVVAPSPPVSPPIESSASDVKTIGPSAFPVAFSLPPLKVMPVVPTANLTITPGSIVSVAPLVTETEPVTTYGLPLAVQVVLVE